MKLTNFALLALLAAGPAAAQNSDLGILFSVSRTHYNLGNGLGETQYRGGLQLNYALQLSERPGGRLYLEIPVASQPGRPTGAFFFTPGLRYHLNMTPRLAVYAAAGIGPAFAHETRYFCSIASTASTCTGPEQRWEVAAAFNVGVGLDFRVTRLLSLRSEFRSFRSISQLGLSGNQYPTVHIGLAAHF